VLALAYGVKFVSSLLYRLGYSWRETLAAGALLSSRLSLIIAVAAIGLDLGSIDEATNAAFLVSTPPATGPQQTAIGVAQLERRAVYTNNAGDTLPELADHLCRCPATGSVL
jgi:Kef-type K+ transport system membrane component KefB